MNVLAFAKVRRIAYECEIVSRDERSIFAELNTRHMIPSIPRNGAPLGTDFVMLEGVDAADFGTPFRFTNFTEQTEVWYYMPRWTRTSLDAYCVECMGRFTDKDPELVIARHSTPMEQIPSYLGGERAYWYRWPGSPEPLPRTVVGKTLNYQLLKPGSKVSSKHGKLIYAFLVTIGPDKGEAGAVFATR